MDDYKLPFTGQEIEEKLKKIEDGGTGYTEGETIHTIDPKFIPGVVLPVVEFETVLSNGAVLSEADIAKLTAMNGGCFIAKCGIDNGEGGGIPMTLMFSSALAIEGMFLYSAISNSSVLENICISNLEGTWKAAIQTL